eukprot:CAMPEP_0114626418 /NCGR_PEP_ID=MMETSP0168-20121206/11771_1 /TAXON_ID=95228 ORGANISM="Vannella sp., Strain DIVA3 517/6/12" /NCGR_SAMPLE_ID=MMETSP0168 /ASSEMBLY_ACC=CAM_ASM_000044 /LENGTH=304 /DNA_ID=CAMNT_0001837721 /DNA_START=32 /DNA_END=946 /DNA_ORIENTATION=+
MPSYAEDPAWKDVTPLPQNEGPTGVIEIAYTPEFREAMDYLRAVVQMDEKSERVLALTADVIDMNPANYTAWYYRRLVLKELGSDLEAELKLTQEIAEECPKNYQVWHHRRCLVEELGDGKGELAFTDHILELDDDSKNYHAWSHRQWALKAYNVWEGELEFVERKLQEDLRNNSAWNHRYFVVSSTEDVSDAAVGEREIGYAFSWIQKAPNNQSPWNYIHGFVPNGRISLVKGLKGKCRECVEKYPTSAHALAMLCDILEDEGTIESLTEAAEVCDTLMERDSIRKKYWQYKKDGVAKKKAST